MRPVGRLAADVVRHRGPARGARARRGRRRPGQHQRDAGRRPHDAGAGKFWANDLAGAASELARRGRGGLELRARLPAAQRGRSAGSTTIPPRSPRSRPGSAVRTGWRPAGPSCSRPSATSCSATATAPSPPSRAPCSTSATTSTAGSAWARRWSTTPASAARPPQDARPAFERMAALDSTFAPIYYHLVDLAVYAGDSAAAATFPPPRPAGPSVPRRARSPRSASGSARRASARRRSRRSGGRPPGDQRGGDRLGARRRSTWGWRTPPPASSSAPTGCPTIACAARTTGWRPGRPWAAGPRATPAWDSVARSVTIDPWLVQAVLAGLSGARPRGPDVRVGPRPDARRPHAGLHASRRGTTCARAFEALVYRAVVEGDSAETGELLRRIDRAPPPPPSEPAAEALRWSLRARLALLAHDTTGAVAALRRAVARIAETLHGQLPAHRGRPAALPARPPARSPGATRRRGALAPLVHRLVVRR